MSNKVKSWIAVAVLGAATGFYNVNGAAADSIAAQSLTVPTTASAPPTEPHRLHCNLLTVHRHHQKGPWHLGLNRDKHLTEADARTITKAALLIRGHHDLQVGTVSTKMSKHGHKFYLIDIINQQNKSVSRVVLNSRNGHIFPLHAHH